MVKHVVKGYFRPEQGRSQEEKVLVPQRVFGLVDFTGANRAPAPKEGEIPTVLWMLFQLNYLAGNIIPLSCPINRVTQLRKPVLLYTGNEEKAIPKFNFTPPRKSSILLHRVRSAEKGLRRRGEYGKMKNIVDETYYADKLGFVGLSNSRSLRASAHTGVAIPRLEVPLFVDKFRKTAR